MEKSIHSAQYVLFLKVFRQTRQRVGLTQVDLAKRVGESQSFISKCERGERRINVVELGSFCRAFGVSLKGFVTSFERAVARRRRL
jgi:transcriptional regulator with XRE-family HTH domain